MLKETYGVGHHSGEKRSLVIVGVELGDETAGDDHLDNKYYGM